MKIIIFLTCLLLTACMENKKPAPAPIPAPQPASVEEDLPPTPDVPKKYDGVAGEKLDACAKKHAVLLDDDVSEATQIAKGVAGKCRREISAYIKSIRGALQAKGASLASRDETEKDMRKFFADGLPFLRLVIDEIKNKACAGKPNKEECLSQQ